MDPISAIALGKSILSATGLDGKISEWFGDKLGEHAAKAVAGVAQAVVGDTNVAAMTPDQRAAVREQIIREKKYLLEAAQRDLESARNMQIAALQQEDLFSKRFIYFFASAWSLFAMVYIIAITFTTLPEGAQRYADTILGFLLGTIVAAIIQFFFGSSLGSKAKDALRALSK